MTTTVRPARIRPAVAGAIALCLLAGARQGRAQEAGAPTQAQEAQAQEMNQAAQPGTQGMQFQGTGIAGAAVQVGPVPQAPIGLNGARPDTLVISQGLSEVDNVSLTPNGGSQTVSTTGVDFRFLRSGANFNANAAGDLQYLAYLQGAYPGKLFGRVNGEADASMFDHRLTWEVQDNYGDAQVNPLTPVTPQNMEHVNVLTAGPNLTLMPFTDVLVQMGARYGRASYQTNPFDGDQYAETFSIARILSPVSDIALVGNFAQKRFDNTVLNTDYDRSEFYLRYRLTGARTQVRISAGEGQDNDGPGWTRTGIGEIEIQHALSAVVTATLSAGRNLTDASTSFSEVQAGAAGGISIAPVTLTTSSYLANYAAGTVQAKGTRTTIAFTARWERDSYAQDSAVNVTRGDYQVSLERQLSRMVTARVFGLVDRSNYFNAGFAYNDYQGGLEATVTPGRHFSFLFRYAHATQVRTVAGEGYKENLVYVGVSWQPFAPPEPAPIDEGVAP